MKIIDAIKTKGISKKVLVVGGVVLAGLAVGYTAMKKNETLEEAELDEVAVTSDESEGVGFEDQE